MSEDRVNIKTEKKPSKYRRLVVCFACGMIRDLSVAKSCPHCGSSHWTRNGLYCFTKEDENDQ
jgi:rRNA maturation endonuclease Nob1